MPVTPVPPLPPSHLARVAESGFGQTGRQAGFAFVVENPSATAAVERTAYVVAAYDPAGTILGAESGVVEVLLPQQRVGIGGTLFVPGGTQVSRVEVQLTGGTAAPVAGRQAYTSMQVAYAPGPIPYVRGVVLRPTVTAAAEVWLNAVLYDATGRIIGGGFAVAGIIDHLGLPRPVEVPVTSAGAPARVKL
jgi:hypothetical protein